MPTSLSLNHLNFSLQPTLLQYVMPNGMNILCVILPFKHCDVFEFHVRNENVTSIKHTSLIICNELCNAGTLFIMTRPKYHYSLSNEDYAASTEIYTEGMACHILTFYNPYPSVYRFLMLHKTLTIPLT